MELLEAVELSTKLRKQKTIISWKNVAKLVGTGTEDSLRSQWRRNYGDRVDEGADKRLQTLANESLRVKEERKILNIQRSMVDSRVREWADKKVVSDTIMAVWGKEPYHQKKTQIIKLVDSKEEIAYAFGDVHYDYNIDENDIFYNKSIAEQRIWEIFNAILKDVRLHGYKQIYLIEAGDGIEGAALRISQLLRITEEMTQQANEYASIIVSCIKWLSKELSDVSITFLMVSLDNHSQLRLYNTKRDEMKENLCILITNTLKNVIDTAHEYGGMSNITFVTADEILLTLGETKPFNVVIAHGHQYTKSDDILEQTEKHHKCPTHLYIGAHWHRYSVKSKDVKDETLQAIIHLPSVVGNTDFSDKIFVSGMPGFCKITIDLTHRISNGVMIPLDS